MRRLLACLLCGFAFQATTAAHALDEYVQAAQIALAPEGVRVELRLTTGVFVTDRVYAIIDVDGDGQISPAEEQAYARRVMQEVGLEVDGRRAPLRLTGSEFPSPREIDEGVGAIRLDLTADAELATAGEHQLTFRNGHLPALSAYLVNALVPTTSETKIGGQERDPLQRELRLSVHVTPADRKGPRLWTDVLMLCLCLVLLIPPWKCLRRVGG
jgi:hypothetical protein